MTAIPEITIEKLKEFDALGCHSLYHFNLTDEELITRLRTNIYSTNDAADVSSTFSNEKLAIKLINLTLKVNAYVIDKWLKYKDEKRLIISHVQSIPCGFGYVRGTSFSKKYMMKKIIIVLEDASSYGENFVITTAYPAPDEETWAQIIKDRNAFKKHMVNNRRH